MTPTGKLIPKAKVTDGHRLLAHACALLLDLDKLEPEMTPANLQLVAEVLAKYEAAVREDAVLSEQGYNARHVEQFLLSL